MWNCRWLLCLVLIGLATREASSMNEQPRMKNDSSKTGENDASTSLISLNTNSGEKRNSHVDPSLGDRDRMIHSSPVTTATTDLVANSTTSNATAALVPDTVAETSTNAGKLGPHDHSKRHFHRSKLYRKEARAKSHTSLIKSNVASGNLTPFSTDHSVSQSQDLFHHPDHNRDSIKLLELMPSVSSIGLSRIRGATSSRDDSISTASPRSPFTSGSKDTSDRKFDELSSTENWDNSSSSFSSSEAGSTIDEKSSSVELMAFTFDNLDQIRNSTFPNEVIKAVENVTASSLIAMDHFSSTTIATVQASARSIDKLTSISVGINHGEIGRVQSIQSARIDANHDSKIYSVPNELSISMRQDNMTKADSGIPVSPSSESLVSRSPRKTSTKGVGASGNGSNSTSLENNSNHSRPDLEEHSSGSVDDSSNRISLADVVETLKNVNLKETSGSYSHSNSTVSRVSRDTALESKIRIMDSAPVSPKHSRSFIVPDVAQSSRELRPSMSRDPETKFSDSSNGSPAVSTKKIKSPMKLIVPLIIDAIAKARTRKPIVAEDVNLSRPSSSTNYRQKYSDQRIAEREEKPSRFALDHPGSSSSQCSSDSPTEELKEIRRIDSENPFYQRRSNEMTLSVSGNRIADPEQCLTRRSAAQTLLHSTHEPDRPISAPVSSVTPFNSEETEIGASLSVNKSHEREAEAAKSSKSAINEPRGAQNFVSSGFLFFDDLEPVVHESLASEEAVLPFETQTTTAGNFFTAFAEPEEHCNASSYNVFIPSVNSRESIATVEPGEKPSSASHKPQNLTTTEDNLYIIEGFGFLKNSIDDISELEEMFDRKRDASFEYDETETYPENIQPDDHPPAVKFIDQIDFEAELPVKQEPLIATGLQWRGNIGDRNDDSWWFINESKRRRGGQAVENDDVEDKTALTSREFPAPKEVHAILSPPDKVLPDMTESTIDSYRIFFLPTIYVLIGICVVLVGCSIWCSKVSVKRQPNIPKLTCFIQERQGATQAV